ncbi:hypothetical protein AAG906_002357 [Vitis piasezkii]
MGKVNFDLPDLISKNLPCKDLVTNVKVAAAYILGFFAVVFLSNIARAFLRSYQQPRMVAETLVGIVAGNIILTQEDHRDNIVKTLNDIIEFGMIFHMLALGLEMDARILFQRPTQEAIVAFSGMLSTFILAYLLTPYFNYSEFPSHEFTVSLSVTLTGTASPLLTRLITDLKIGKSDIGRLLVAAGTYSDLVSTLFISIGFVIISADKNLGFRDSKDILKITSTLIVQVVVTAVISPILMIWVNHENPAGKSLKGSHMVLSVAFVAISCGCSAVKGKYSPMMSAFITGIALPREGRLSKMMISKLNYFLKCIFYPIFFVWVGLGVDFQMFNPGNPWTWARMIFIFVIATLGKVVGTFLSGLMLGFNLPESVALGLLLNVKGHFHMFLALFTFHMKNHEMIMTTSTRIGLTLAIFFTVIYAPLVGAYIIRRARKRSPNQRMSLQWLDSENELRVLLCIHGPQHLPSTINFIEISRGRDDPGIMVYVTDMIELTEQIESTLVHREGVEVVTVTDRAVIEMRDQITTAIKTYEEEHESGITLRRMLALSPFSVMHQDICHFARDLNVTLIVLPFHKYPAEDGKMTGADSKFRFVNKKVLQNAPCSVGILVDRGFGVTSKISRTSIFLHAAVIFIGGKDDREALVYASHVAQHPGVKLTVLRFLLDANANSKCTRPGTSKVNLAEQEEEMQLDDEFFAGFYERHVGGQVAYMEKYLANSGGRVNSALTAGMNDWEQCPELGPIGDILSGSAFAVSASILIIQQHSPKED